jgi:integrase
MKITLRQRQKNNKISLYLEYYEKGRREYEYLNLYLIPDPEKGSLTKFQKDENKRILELAETIRSKRHLETQNIIYGFKDKDKVKGSFKQFFSDLAEMKRESLGNYGNWNAVRIYIDKYSPKDVSFERVNKDWVQGFRDYLDRTARTKHGKPLALNSKYSYFNKLIAALNQAVKEQIIPSNPAYMVEPFPQDETQREFLTLDELTTLANTPCTHETLRKMFLFSCITGLRWGDVEKLIWQEIQHSKENGYYIRFKQEKTTGAETLPISEEARSLCGEEGHPNDLVFTGLKYGNWNQTHLKSWLRAAGITKHITYHCSRHTYATLQLTLGTDIYTVSKLLGHKNLSTTEIYAKVVNEKKVEAANKINLNLK